MLLSVEEPQLLYNPKRTQRKRPSKERPITYHNKWGQDSHSLLKNAKSTQIITYSQDSFAEFSFLLWRALCLFPKIGWQSSLLCPSKIAMQIGITAMRVGHIKFTLKLIAVLWYI